MKHQKGNKKLSKPTDQRLALLKNLLISLVENNRIVTTQLRAKQAKAMIEKIITMSKIDSVYSRRKVKSIVSNKDFVKNVFEVSKRYLKRNGGYTRIINVGIRKGDNAKLALLEFVE